MIEFELEQSGGSPNRKLSNVEFQASLEPEADGPQEIEDQPAAKLVVLEEPQLSASNRTAKLRCKIQYGAELSQDGKNCRITIASTEDCSIAPVTTNTICLVNYKLKVTPIGEWESIWYKDEGGRDKSIEMVVQAQDKKGRRFPGTLPLIMELCYHIPTKYPKVTNQDFLRTLGSEKKLQIEKRSGKAKIRLRIEDVSKNHQGQQFAIMFAPDKAQMKNFKCIAPLYTPGVLVRSKRNKRLRAPAPPTESKRMVVPRINIERTVASSPEDMRGPPSSIETGARVERVTPRQVLGAMQGVLHWAEEVLNGLCPLQWTALGYGHNTDGSVDYANPYHSMQNPNPTISRLLSMYSESTREHFRVLQHAVDRLYNSGAQTLGGTPTVPLPTTSRDNFGILTTNFPQPSTPNQGQTHIMQQQSHLQQQQLLPVQSQPTMVNIPTQQAPPAQSIGVLPQQATIRQPIMNAMEFRDLPLNAQPPQLPPGSTYISNNVPLNTGILHTSQQLTRHDPLEMRLEQIESRENEVQYILAKQYKSCRTKAKLGFPAYSADREILGFYRESNKVGTGEFVAISEYRDDFGERQKLQAKEILIDAMATESKAVHSLSQWGSIQNMINHALVYNWSKDIDNDPVGYSSNINNQI